MENSTQYRLKEAMQFLYDANYLYMEKFGNLQILVKLYHAMLYSLFALLHIRDIGNRSHMDIIETFKAEFVVKGIFNKVSLDALYFAHTVTHDCNCTHPTHLDKEDIDRVLPVARDFVKSVKEYLENN